MGQFEQEPNVLKRYARRGQCFSTTVELDKLEIEHVRTNFEDVERNGHTFSDGCGLIHPDYAQELAKKHRFSRISAL